MSTVLQEAAAELSDVENLPPTASPMTSKKKARENKLREDVFCEVLNATSVRCLNCGKNIKLSLKSDFDSSHWVRHRGRCLKRSKALERAALQSESVEASPTSSARALSIPPAEEEGDPAADSENPDVTDPSLDTPAATLQVQPPEFEWLSWQSWDWSKLKCRFPVPKDL